MNIGGITFASSTSVSDRPRMTLKKSIPAFVYAAAIRMASSGPVPLPSGRCSSNDIRIPTMKSSPTAARIAAITSSGNLIRFSSGPPYSSWRWLNAGVMNSSSRCPL